MFHNCLFFILTDIDDYQAIIIYHMISAIATKLVFVSHLNPFSTLQSEYFFNANLNLSLRKTRQSYSVIEIKFKLFNMA